MTNVVNLRPCTWSDRDVDFAVNVVQALAEKYEQRGFYEAALIARGYIEVLRMMGETQR
jgi:hypothetical protein